ncbi:MAG: flagellar hook-basal body complex protein [Pirellulales bacterium]
MGLQSAMTTALTGLQAAETAIDVVGNNVANSNTVAFKESNVLFSTQFLQTQSIGSAPSTTRGGTNPRQVGLGTKVAAINPDFTQGTIEISANPLDVAVQGDGFLIVQGSQGERLYTRNGQLQTNANNEVVTVTGNRVLGFGVDDDFNIVQTLVPLSIPLGAEVVAQATQTAFFSGVLHPQAEIGDRPSVIESEVLGIDTAEFPDDPAFNLLDFSTVAPPGVAATTTSLAGAGSLAAGDYEYRVAFFADSGGTPTRYEGAPSASFGNITIPAGPNQDIQLTALPTDASWTGRNLYRRVGAGDFELVATLDATTADYLDSTAVGGAVLDDDSLDLANYSYYVAFYNTSTGLVSRPTERIGSLAISDVNRRIRIDNIPQPATPDFNAVRIYRNVSSDTSSFHLVDTLIDGQTTYIDNMPDADIDGNPVVDLMGPKASAGTALTDVVVLDGDDYLTPFELGELTFTGKKGDRTLAPKTLTIAATTTVQDLIEFMDDAFGIDNPSDTPFTVSPGGQINTDGQIQFTANMGIENRLSVALSAFELVPTGSSTPQSISLSFDETEENINGAGSTTDFLVFDSLGIPLTVRLTTVKEVETPDSRTYRWYATSEDNEPSSGVDTVLGNGTITFDANGRILSGGTSTVAVEREITGSQSPLEFTLDFSQVSGLAVSNNLGQAVSSMSLTRQDGFPPGSLTSFIITESGLIRGVFSNGTERPLGQMRMARFANNPGLQQIGENLFTKGINSGEPIEGNPGDAGIGALTAGAVELSNTDIGQNLIELILASTQYRGGTRVITAAQQLLDELLSLRR